MPRWILGCLVIAVLSSGVATAGPVAPNEVCIYEHEDYVGTAMCHHLPPGMRHKLVTIGGYMNDRASSLHVGEDVHVYLYEYAHFGGMRSRYDVSVRTLGKLAHWPDFNDRVSSMIILPKETWQPSGVELMMSGIGAIGLSRIGFYPLPERLNESETRYPHLDGMNDKANFVKLHGDVEVTLYQHTNFDGKPLKLPGAGDNMDYFVLQKYQFEGRASSLVVRARGPQQQVIQGQIKLPPPSPPRDPWWKSTGGTTHRAPPSIEPQTGKVIQPDSGTEINTDRPGLNYRSFDLDVPEPKRCQRTCLDDPKCKAWTYVKPGVQGPKARCWLKSGVPPAKSAPCCISGVKPQ